MKDRITLGHEADVAETAALTLADNCATERIFAALDWEREEKSGKRRAARGRSTTPSADWRRKTVHLPEASSRGSDGKKWAFPSRRFIAN